jgi:SAM-dependent methyltransferase
MPTAGWWEALFPDPAGIASALGVAPGMTVVDLCSGDGWFTLPIARIAHRVIAIDIDADLLEVSAQRLREGGVANVVFVEGNAYDLRRLVTEPVDLVFMANCFHGVPDGTRLAREVCAVLRPGGTFSVLNWHARPREETVVLGEPRGPRTGLRLSPEQTIAQVEAGGLKRAGIVEIPPYHYGALFAAPA